MRRNSNFGPDFSQRSSAPSFVFVAVGQGTSSSSPVLHLSIIQPITHVMSCMNCVENMVGRRRDDRYCSTATTNGHVLRPRRPSTNAVGSQQAGASGHSLTNGHGPHKLVICKEMAYYCFDVLFSHLFRVEMPPCPKFTNDP